MSPAETLAGTTTPTTKNNPPPLNSPAPPPLPPPRSLQHQHPPTLKPPQPPSTSPKRPPPKQPLSNPPSHAAPRICTPNPAVTRATTSSAEQLAGRQVAQRKEGAARRRTRTRTRIGNRHVSSSVLVFQTDRNWQVLIGVGNPRMAGAVLVSMDEWSVRALVVMRA